MRETPSMAARRYRARRRLQRKTLLQARLIVFSAAFAAGILLGFIALALGY